MNSSLAMGGKVFTSKMRAVVKLSEFLSAVLSSICIIGKES